MNRNNTNFPVKSTAKLRELYRKYINAKHDETDEMNNWANTLKYYQYLVKYIMSDPEFGIGEDGNSRGLLIYHTMGMGKTRLAVSIAMSMWDIRPVVIMLPKSLQKNFSSTVNSVIDLLNSDLSEERRNFLKKEAEYKFSFVSMDAYNSASQMSNIKIKSNNPRLNLMKGLNGKLLIVDEAHNFFRSIINSASKQANARQIYDMIMNTNNLRLLFLTGTPASKDPFELVPCFNMLAGKNLLPSTYDTFYQLYIDPTTRGIINKNKLSNRLMGMVSHVTPSKPSEPSLYNIEDIQEFGGERYDIKLLWELTYKLPIIKIPTISFMEIMEQKVWNCTPKEVIEHKEQYSKEYSRIINSDTKWPILILEVDDGAPIMVMDGIHRLAKLIFIEKVENISVRQVSNTIFNLTKIKNTNSKNARDNGWFPEEKTRIIEEIEMSEFQYRQYLLVREKEENEGKMRKGSDYSNINSPALALPGSNKKSVSSYYVKSRTISNFSIPVEWKFNDIDTIPLEVFTEELSPKMNLIVKRANESKGPILIYSQFVEHGGLKPMCKFLQKSNYKQFTGNKKGGVEFLSMIANDNDGTFEIKLNMSILNNSLVEELMRYKMSLEILKHLPDNSHIAYSKWTLSENKKNTEFKNDLKKLGHKNASQIVESIISTIENFSKNNELKNINIKLDNLSEIHISYDGEKYKFQTNQQQIKSLINIAKSNGLDLSQSIIVIIKSLLRYKSILIDSWYNDLPKELFNKLYSIGIRNEGFTTPFHARLLDKPDTSYYSLFPDLDGVLGSKGNYKELFDYDFSEEKNGWFFNLPPFENILCNVIGNILKYDVSVIFHIQYNESIRCVNDLLESDNFICNVDLMAGLHLMERDGIDSISEYNCKLIGYGSLYKDEISKVIQSLSVFYKVGSGNEQYYAVISGDVSSELRDEITETFNSEENAHGALIKVILVSKTGAEGLDLKWLRETHQLEPYWDKARDDQVIARAVRIGSHDGLPIEEREVQPYIYISTHNKKIYNSIMPEHREEQTIDEQFFKKANDKHKINMEFRNLLSTICYECELFGYNDCRTCIPSNNKLFHDDPTIDIKLPDNCEIRTESDVEATPITHEGKTYYYVKKNNDYTFYSFDDELGAFTPLNEMDDLNQILANLIG